MDPKAETIFLNAVELPDEQERAEYLDSICAGDADLRKTVDTMLEDLAKATRFFNESAKNLSIPIELLPDEELVNGKELGPYRIIRLLGEGGSSKVYEAEQLSPVKTKGRP